MSTSAILFTTLTVLVAAHARFIGPPLIRPIMPMPMIGPFHPPMIPMIRPLIHPIHPPIFPIVRQRRVTRTQRIARPPSRPFVMEEPSGFLRREDQPYIVVIEQKPERVEIPRYIDDGTGDISIDGNVYISDPYGVNAINRGGATVEQVISRSVGSGQFTRGDSVGATNEFDYPLPGLPAINTNLNVDPFVGTRPVTLI